MNNTVSIVSLDFLKIHIKIKNGSDKVNFIKARTEEQILSRREEIINAADTLFSRSGYEGVYFKAISALTSIKRPAIYLYYKTKDEVLLDLLKKEMLDWDISLHKVIDPAETMTKEAFCAFLTETVVSHEKMLRLLAILCTNIENQCRVEKVAEFKKKADVAFATVWESLGKFFPHAEADKKAAFMTAFLIYIHGLFPLAFPTQKHIDAMAMAGMEYTSLDFKTAFYRGLMLLAAEL
jgi:AcrR family transcriptional regulator